MSTKADPSEKWFSKHLIYTGWRKKKACFSNNCNFVYLKYIKKLCQHQNNL